MKQAYTLLALGDSLTVGYGAREGFGFADLYRAYLQEHFNKTVDLINAGVNGAATADILYSLQNDDTIRAAVQKADIITITAGGNDLLRAAENYFVDLKLSHLISALRSCQQNYQLLLAAIKQFKKDSSDPYIIRLSELYNPSPDILEAKFCVKRVNKIIRKFKEPNIKVAKVYDAYRGKEDRLLAEDRVHPNEDGYAVIADEFGRLGCSPLN
jgi:lysophospholipase L1-like esterase